MSDTDTKKAKKPTTIGGKPIERTSDADMKALIAKAEKELGEGSLFLGSEIDDQSVLRCTTGVLAFDLMLGGGWPLNQWNEIIGYESNGKTAMVLRPSPPTRPRTRPGPCSGSTPSTSSSIGRCASAWTLSRCTSSGPTSWRRRSRSSPVAERPSLRLRGHRLPPALTTLPGGGEVDGRADRRDRRQALQPLHAQVGQGDCVRSPSPTARCSASSSTSGVTRSVASARRARRRSRRRQGKNYSFFTRVEFSRLGGSRRAGSRSAPHQGPHHQEQDGARRAHGPGGLLHRRRRGRALQGRGHRQGEGHPHRRHAVRRGDPGGLVVLFGPVDESTGKAKYRWNGGDAAYKEVLSDLTPRPSWTPPCASTCWRSRCVGRRRHSTPHGLGGPHRRDPGRHVARRVRQPVAPQERPAGRRVPVGDEAHRRRKADHRQGQRTWRSCAPTPSSPTACRCSTSRSDVTARSMSFFGGRLLELMERAHE